MPQKKYEGFKNNFRDESLHRLEAVKRPAGELKEINALQLHKPHPQKNLHVCV